MGMTLPTKVPGKPKTRPSDWKKLSNNDRLAALSAEMGPSESVAALRSVAAMVERLRATGKRLAATRVLVLYGGGKDSSFAVAFVRYQQMIALSLYGETFQLRVATFRHPGMTPPAVLQNMHSVYATLGLYDDPTVELVLVDGDDVVPFDHQRPIPKAVRDASRRTLLMALHRSGGDARATFCDSCNLLMTRSFRLAAAYGNPVDLIITGDSAAEQRRYAVWTKRAAEELRADTGAKGVGLSETLGRLEKLHTAFNEITEGKTATPLARLVPVDAAFPGFFSLYEYTRYDLGTHRRVVEEYLGFAFDSTAWVFTESDCGNPAIMASMRGLTTERVRGRDYAEGFEEYASFALGLMARKSFPADLIERMAERVRGPEAIEAFRRHARDFLREAFDLEERHLVVGLFSPFTDEGARLDAWITAEAPGLAARTAEIRALAAGESEGTPELVVALAEATALDLDQIRHLWRSPLTPNLADPRAAGSPLAFVRRNDPHKKMIISRGADGAPVREMITGR